MLKVYMSLLFCFAFGGSFAQTERKIPIYLSLQYNKTLYDYTIGNNPWGIGLGLQAFLRNKTMFEPTVELTGDVYLEDDKTLRLNPDGSIPVRDNDVGGMTNLFAGFTFKPVRSVYLSFTAGPSFIRKRTYLGVKPSLGFYFSKTKKWTAKVSYINITNRVEITDDDFGSLSLAVGCKLF
jgi:hypothetical protein